MELSAEKGRIKRKGEVSLRQKGSLTVECALILPLFFLAVVVLTGMLDLYRLQIRIQTALSEGARELAMYAYCREGEDSSPVGLVEDAVCGVYGMKKVRDSLEGERLSQILGGINGIVFTGSGYQNDTVTLKASFYYASPVAFFRLFPVRISLDSQARAWTGYKGVTFGSQESEELVYVTEWESVYHTSAACTHISLDIQKVSLAGVENSKNEYGEHYHPCEKCVGDSGGSRQVYITRTGDCYHNSLDCPGLTRTVMAVKKSQASALRECSRCRGE